MKTLLKQFALVLFVLPLAFSGVVGASHYWKVEMSDPTTADQLRSFNIEFTALSTDSSDRITVKLLENNQQVGELRTPGGGGSGVFNVTVAEDNVYTYEMRAFSEVDGPASEDTVATRTVRVSTPEDEITVIEVDPELTPEEEAALADPDPDADPTEVEGEITDEAAVTDADDVLGVEDDTEDGEVLGAEDEDDDETAALVRNILIIAALLALGYYIFFRGRGNLND